MRSFLRRYGVELVLLGHVLFSGAYFYNGYHVNHLARLDVILAFVEPGTDDFLSFRIDRFILNSEYPDLGANTVDWARNPDHDDHFYSNKAPGVHLAGIPVYAVMYAMESAMGIDPRAPLPTFLNGYLLNLVLTVLPMALATVAMYRLLWRLRPDRPGLALWLALGFFYGTLLFPYSTQMWGHATAAAALVGGLYYLVRGGRRDFFWCGLLVGLAVLCEYTCALTVVALGAWLLIARQWPKFGAFILGGLGPLLVFGIYHHACFGSPFTAATLHNNPAFHETDQMLGVFGGIELAGFWGLTFSRYRGLFWYVPGLTLVLPALYWLRHRREDCIYWFCLVNFCLYFLLTLMFNNWHGGACVGPRYLIVGIPFLVVLISRLPWRGGWVWLGGALGTVSAINMFIISAVTPLVPTQAPNALPRLYYTFWVDRLKIFPDLFIRFQPVPQELLNRWSSFNLGELLGLSGKWSTMPWLVGVAMLSWLLLRSWSRCGPGRGVSGAEAPEQVGALTADADNPRA